jgi:hypothetical protein
MPAATLVISNPICWESEAVAKPVGRQDFGRFFLDRGGFSYDSAQRTPRPSGG